MANTLTGLELWEPKVRMGMETEGSARGRIPKGWDAWLGDAPVTGNSVRAERGHPALPGIMGTPEPRALPSPHSGRFLGIWGLTFKVKADLSLNRIHSQLLRALSFIALLSSSQAELWGATLPA